ncbi:hypothetical protein HHS34_010045 [Acidithiobacillus montserratensis]|uniref:Uncharacterized protein n=1 Tax=Acidithiobacillus montserratensis TaxID=2729135 RepID=A0ACD5HCW6_9PROT|nr:hypothetical protein [Acidithiobacillus montserratensis]MBU2747217.1 hypothetical protein [Acidithiobacillus montserratensis]
MSTNRSIEIGQRTARAVILILISIPFLLHRFPAPTYLLLAAMVLCFSSIGWLMSSILRDHQADPIVREAAKNEWSYLAHRGSSIFKSRLNSAFKENGALGNQDSALAKSTAIRQRSAGRQHGGHRASIKKPGSKSSDDDGGGGEPPQSAPDVHSFQPQKLYSYQLFAELVCASRQTVYNLVSLGKLSKPIRTLAGPRFTINHYLEFVGQTAEPEPVPPPSRRRGRPRIVDIVDGGRL